MAKLLQMPLLFEDAPEFVPPQEEAEPEPKSSSSGLADADAREKALDIRRSWIVEAPAGSGKTGLLIQRYLKLLAFGGVDRPDEVLAITFTRKAGAEMRRRVLEQLAAAKNPRPLPEAAGEFAFKTRDLAVAVLDRDRRLGWSLLDNPQQLNIRTIDSFCAELAGTLPLTAGPGGRYAPTDDPQPLYETAAQRTLLNLGGADPVLTQDLETLLLHRDANPGDFIRLLADMLKQRDEWGELVPLRSGELTDEALDQHVRPRLTQTLHRLISQELQTAADLIGPNLLDRLATLAHTLSACPPYNGDPSPLAICSERPYSPRPLASELDHWNSLVNLVLLKTDGAWRVSQNSFYPNNLKFEATPIQRRELQDLVAELRSHEEQHPSLRDALCAVRNLPSPEYPDDHWQIVKALCRTLRYALLELQIVFAERRSCDFAEVALTALSLLRSDINAAEILHSSAARLRHLLVDEMQDTSAGQYELLERVTQSWDGATQTLFLVGDPKQSIYEFRQARVERFLRTMNRERLGSLPVGALRLTSNFRSQATLLEAFNENFQQILPGPGDLEDSDSGDVPFVAAKPTRPARSGPALVWHGSEDLRGDDPERPSEGADPDVLAPTPAAHARSIRDQIEVYLAGWPSRPGASGKDQRRPKVAVLARNRAHLAPIIQEFHQDRGHGPLPFRAVDVEALNERPEILDLLALTRALLHPADRIAWLSVLRSPVCGLTLPDLLALTGEGPDADLQATIPELIQSRALKLSSDGKPRLQRAWGVLQQALAGMGRTSLCIHVERTWRSLGGDAYLQPHEQTNVRRFFELLHVTETAPEGFTLSLLGRRLKTLYAQPASADTSVELMTIHKAKGLEWDLVVIPALHRGSGRNSHPFLKWLEFDDPDGAPEFLLAPVQSKGDESSSLSKWLDRRQRRREAAEAKRLFYVACTRAREELHLFATVSRKADGSFSRPATDSLLAAAWPAAEPVFAAQLRSTLEGKVIPFEVAQVAPEPLALAAAADSVAIEHTPERSASALAGLRRLPLDFDPLARFRRENGPGLDYPAASTLRHHAPFLRPEGSYRARAFGNTVHRFLQAVAARLATGDAASTLIVELPSWQRRLDAVLRNEGLPPSIAAAEAQRGVLALSNSLQDPAGRWLLSPHLDARDEAPIPSVAGEGDRSLRADRTFRAGPVPGLSASPDFLWIVDYKTAELGGRSAEDFMELQKQTYMSQMQTYAQAAVAEGHAQDRVILALYLPLLPALVYWRADEVFGPK